MDSLIKLWLSTGLSQIELGQAVMMLVAFGMLYLAIKKGFEPLLLLPIAVGTLLVNIPGAGIGWSAAESAIRAADPAMLENLRGILHLAPDVSVPAMIEAYYSADGVTAAKAVKFASEAGYENGFLYTFYKITIASGIAPLLIFVGVGAMTDFGPLLANPKTLLLGAAAQFGIFGTLFGAVLFTDLGL